MITHLRCDKILVNGASRGIGFAIAKKLANEGAKVVIGGRNIETLKEAAKAIGENAYPMVLDALQVETFDAKLDEAESLIGNLNGLVNCAGACAYYREWGDAMFEQTLDDWNTVMNTNARAPYFLSRALVRRLIDRKAQGNILNVISEAAFVPASSSYGASKTALLGLTRGLAQYCANKGIIVNGIAPGTTETTFVDLKHEYEMHRQPNGRLATVDEMADLAAFIMSKEAENIIGQTILSCGGSTI